MAFTMHRVHLGDLSIYCIDLLLPIEDDLMLFGPLVEDSAVKYVPKYWPVFYLYRGVLLYEPRIIVNSQKKTIY